MPLYEYRCKSCGNVFEVSHSMSASGPESCPTCGGKPERLVSGGAGIIM